MSGHSHFATIKRQKAVNDAAKGNLFSKLARAIMIAAKSGPDPDSNFKLRVEIDKARSFSMPKENIERAIAKATSEAANLEEITYEGFGPGGINILVQTATDNKNRTAQEVKNIFERGGGKMGGPGAVAHNFVSKGFMVVTKSSDAESQMMSLIDAGVEDVEEYDDAFDVYVAPEKLSEIHTKLKELGFDVVVTELRMKPLMPVDLTEPEKQKAINLLENLDNIEEAQNVFSNLNV